jgi:hypothetical protein
MDQKRIDEIWARCETATRGPWSHKREYIYSLRENGQRDMSVGECTTWNEMAYENATFIANARQDVPDLLDALEEAQAESKRPRDDRKDWSVEALADVAEIEERHGIELVSIAFCEQLSDALEEARRARITMAEQLHKQTETSLQFTDRMLQRQNEIAVATADVRERIVSLVAENEQLQRENKRLAQERDIALGLDGKWHEARICTSCGALFKKRGGSWLGNHTTGCKVLEKGR